MVSLSVLVVVALSTAASVASFQWTHSYIAVYPHRSRPPLDGRQGIRQRVLRATTGAGDGVRAGAGAGTVSNTNEKNFDWITSGTMPVAENATKKTAKKTRNSNYFSRTNRVDGQKKWIKELHQLKKNLAENSTQKQAGATFLVVEIARELLYSGIPEQVLELYAAYYDLIFKPSSTSDSSSVETPVIPDVKLIVVTARAFIAMGDVQGALALLQACARASVKFDTETQSALIADLAVSSPQGLEAALGLRSALLEKKENLSWIGAEGLLKGIRLHGLSKKSNPVGRLLVDLQKESELLKEELGDTFRLSCGKAEQLAIDIVEPFLAGNSTTTKRSKATNRVFCELLRVLFRSSFQNVRTSYDSNFQVDREQERQQRVISGLRSSLTAMNLYGISWDINIADVLMDECLKVGDVNGVKFVVQSMWDNQLQARTSTFNALLKRYADNGDGESAYKVVMEVMLRSPSTEPDSTTWSLLLSACMKTRRGRFFAKKVMESFMESLRDSSSEGDDLHSLYDPAVISKDMWDLFLQLKVLSGEPYLFTLKKMILAGCQPDQATMHGLYSAFEATGDGEEAIKLYDMQYDAEVERRLYRGTILAIGQHDLANSKFGERLRESGSSPLATLDPFTTQIENVSESESVLLRQILRSALPPPASKSYISLLEMLKSCGQYQKAIVVLNDICERARDPGPVEDRLFYRDESTEGKYGVDMGKVGTYDAFSYRSNLKRADSVLKSPNHVANAIEFPTESDVAAIPSSYSSDRKVIPMSLTASGRSLLMSQFSPDCQIYALVIESCVDSARLDLALDLVAQLENWGLKPDRRIYSALIRGFGSHGDVLSALGVFQEMRQHYFPDVMSLQSILDVCMSDPADLRQMALLLEDMTESEFIDLDVYSKDILMQGFDDAATLSAALVNMEEHAQKYVGDHVTASFSVISVLVQAARKKLGVQALTNALTLLGKIGIRPDEETMEYFRMAPTPAMIKLMATKVPGEGNSRDNNGREGITKDIRKLMKHQKRVRSLMDVGMPTELGPDLSLPVRYSSKPANARSILSELANDYSRLQANEPYFESNNNVWAEHTKAIQAIVNLPENPQYFPDFFQRDDEDAFENDNFVEEDESEFDEHEKSSNPSSVSISSLDYSFQRQVLPRKAESRQELANSKTEGSPSRSLQTEGVIKYLEELDGLLDKNTNWSVSNGRTKIKNNAPKKKIGSPKTKQKKRKTTNNSHQ